MGLQCYLSIVIYAQYVGREKIIKEISNSLVKLQIFFVGNTYIYCKINLKNKKLMYIYTLKIDST